MAVLSTQHALTFKEIDTLHRCSKGTAFRAFKRLGEQLVEGEHYYYFSAQTHGAEIETLRRAGRLYAATVNAVLLTRAGYELLKKEL
jgi:hypothetical protein